MFWSFKAHLQAGQGASGIIIKVLLKYINIFLGSWRKKALLALLTGAILGGYEKVGVLFSIFPL